MRILLISILGLLMLASCTKQEPMEALIDRVFTVAEHLPLRSNNTRLWTPA